MIFLLMAGCFVVALLLAWGLNWLGLIPWRRSAGQHWTEQARLLFPARKSARLHLVALPVILALGTYILAPQVNLLFAAVPAFVGALLAGYPMNRAIFPKIRLASWLHLVTAILLLFFSPGAVLLLGVVAMPGNFGARTWAIAGAVLLALVAFLFGLGVRLMCWLRLLQAAPEYLQVLVGEISQKMGVPVRATWVLSTYLSNAAALPLTRQLIFTGKLLATHPEAEIKAIGAHELGHLNEPRRVRFTRVLLLLALFPVTFVKPLLSFGYGLIPVLGALLVGVLILLFVAIGLGRRMEKRADKFAIESEFINPEVYARALERLYQTNQMPAVMPRRSGKIHPDLYDRMLAAGVTPDFPKPPPPSRLSWTSYVALAGLFALPVLALFIKALWAAWQTWPNSSPIDAGGT